MRADDIQARAVDPEDLRVVRELLYQNPACRASREVLFKYVFSLLHALQMYVDREQRTLRTPFVNFLHAVFRPVGQDAIDSLLTLGVVPIYFTRASEGSDWIPHVLPSEVFELVVEWKQHRVHYDVKLHLPDGSVRRWGVSKLRTKVFVLRGFGWDPQLGGVLRSPLRSLCVDFRAIRHLREQALIAEAHNALPPIVVEPAIAGGGHALAPGVTRAGLLHDTLIQGQWAPNEARRSDAEELAIRSRDQLEMQLSMQHFIHGRRLKFRRDHYFPDQRHLPLFTGSGDDHDDDNEGAEAAAHERSDQLPRENVAPGMRSAHAPLAAPRSDLVAQYKLMDERIFAVMGVPRSVIVNDTVVRGNVEAMNETLRRTVDQWTSILSQIYTWLYIMMFEVPHLSVPELQLHLESNVDGWELSQQVGYTIEVRVPSPFHISDEQLRRRLEDGIIDFRTYAAEMQLVVGRPDPGLDVPIATSKLEVEKDVTEGGTGPDEDGVVQRDKS